MSDQRVVPTLPEDPAEVDSLDFFVELLWAAAMALYLDERELTERELDDVYTAAAMLVSAAMAEQAGAEIDELHRLFIEQHPMVSLGLTVDLDLQVAFAWDDGRECGVIAQRKEPSDG